MQKKQIIGVLAGLTVAGTLLGNYLAKEQGSKSDDQKAKIIEVSGSKKQSGILPGGAGVLLKDNQIVLAPEMNENRDQYEKRLNALNETAPQVGYTFVSIINAENKAAYDAFMMDFYARQGKIYNMILDPKSSWASMQIGAGKVVAGYTPYDILKAQQKTKEEVAER